MIIEENHFTKSFLSKFTSDDTAAYKSNESSMQRDLDAEMHQNLDIIVKNPKSDATTANNSALKHTIQTDKLEELDSHNKATFKIRSHSTPCQSVNKVSGDLSLMWGSLKSKGSKMRMELFSSIQDSSVKKILRKHLAETRFLVGMSPSSMIADSGMTLSNILTLVKGSKLIEEVAKNSRSESDKRVVKAAKKVRFILSDMYNNLVMMDSFFGRSNFRNLVTDFQKRNQNRKDPKDAIRRSVNKMLYDSHLDSDFPELAVRERVKRNDVVGKLLRNRMSHMQSSKVL